MLILAYYLLLMAMIPKQIYAGNILFFMPLIPKSSRITWMPIVEELATRKHNASSNKKILNFLKPKIAKKLIHMMKVIEITIYSYR